MILCIYALTLRLFFLWQFLDGRVLFVELAKPRSQPPQGVKQDSVGAKPMNVCKQPTYACSVSEVLIFLVCMKHTCPKLHKIFFQFEPSLIMVHFFSFQEFAITYNHSLTMEIVVGMYWVATTKECHHLILQGTILGYMNLLKIIPMIKVMLG